MALPIAVGEMIDLAKFAYKLWNSCKAAKGQFEQVGREVFAMRTAIELASVNCQDQNIVKIAGGKQSTIWQNLRTHIRNCKRALSDVDELLRRYKRMSLLDRMAWALRGASEVADLESNLSSFATQLDSFITNLTLRGVGMMGAQLSQLRRKVGPLGRIEEELEKNNGDDAAAVKNIMRDMRDSGISNDTANHFTRIFGDYAQEVRRSEASPDKQRAPTPDPHREQHRRLSVSNSEHRSRSAGTSNHSNDHKPNRSNLKNPTDQKHRKYTLECWLIQIKSADAMFVTIKRDIKEKQVRGQWKLEQMAKQFLSCSQVSRLANNHDLVNWVLADRKKAEDDPNYTWYPYTAKIERKSSIFLGLGIEEQAMVIIKRQMTREAQRRADEEARKEAEKLAAAKKKAEEAAKKKAEEAAKKKAEEAAEKKTEQESAKQTVVRAQKIKAELEQARAQRIKNELEQERQNEQKKGKGKGKEAERAAAVSRPPPAAINARAAAIIDPLAAAAVNPLAAVIINVLVTVVVDVPAAAVIDAPAAAVIDAPAAAVIDAPAAAVIDAPAAAVIDVPAAAVIDAPAAVIIDAPVAAEAHSSGRDKAKIAPKVKAIQTLGPLLT